MPKGVEDFHIEDVNLYSREEEMAHGSVVFQTDNPDLKVTHRLTVKVRVKVPSDGAIQSLNEALFQEAVAQLTRALERSKGKSARELNDDAKARAKAERDRPFSVEF